MKQTNKAGYKMQDVSFRNMHEFLAYLPEEEYRMVELLRHLILECIPEVNERLSFNVPFYKVRKDICFIWPAAVLWGQKKSYDGVRLGFSRGHLIHDEQGILDLGNRKQVAYLDFKTTKEIHVEWVKGLFYQALLIDKESTIHSL